MVLIIATAAAPCLNPSCARRTRAHTPRNVTTSFPVIAESTYSDSLQPSEIVASGLRRTTIGSAVLSVNGTPFEFCAATVVPVFSARFAAGKVGRTESSAATLSTLSPDPGDDSM